MELPPPPPPQNSGRKLKAAIIAVALVAIVIASIFAGTQLISVKESPNPPPTASFNSPSSAPSTLPSSNSEPTMTPQPPYNIDWLQQGKSWLISYTWTHDYGSIHGKQNGSYTMRLGDPYQIGDKKMWGIIIENGGTEYLPLWGWIGTDFKGNIYGMKDANSEPHLIFSYVNDAFNQDASYVKKSLFADFGNDWQSSLNRNVTINGESGDQITVAAFGYGENLDLSGGGFSSTYINGFGTVYNYGGSAYVQNHIQVEFWSQTTGPVGLHYESHQTKFNDVDSYGKDITVSAT